MTGGIYHERTDWWSSILQVPPPRIVVLEDTDAVPGVGAFVGGVHAAILKALGCVGYVTNGAVRELPRVRSLGLQLFAGNVAVSHAYSHIFDFGCAVNIAGLEIVPGSLLHGDMHGLLTIPKEIADKVPPVANKLLGIERKLAEFCQSKEFSLDQLRSLVKDLG
jgi:regulator of RNase E activity RraA